jgi:hypothetical protein
LSARLSGDSINLPLWWQDVNTIFEKSKKFSGSADIMRLHCLNYQFTIRHPIAAGVLF